MLREVIKLRGYTLGSAVPLILDRSECGNEKILQGDRACLKHEHKVYKENFELTKVFEDYYSAKIYNFESFENKIKTIEQELAGKSKNNEEPHDLREIISELKREAKKLKSDVERAKEDLRGWT